MSELTAQRRRSGPVPRVSRIDGALDAMIGRVSSGLRAIGVEDVADGLASVALAPSVQAADGGVIGLPTGLLEPVDRLVAALRVTATDRDLLALSLISHRHAAVAAAMRGLHPERFPWPTLGLACGLAEHGLLARVSSTSDLFEALEASTLLAVGAIEVTGAGPMPERSLRPGALVWEGVSGLGGWGAEVEVDPLPAPTWGLERWLADRAVEGARSALAENRQVGFLAVTDRPETVAARLATLAERAGRTPVILRVERLHTALVTTVLMLATMRDVVPVLSETGDNDAHLELVVPDLPVPLVLARRHAGITAWPRPLVVLPVGSLSVADRVSAVRAVVPELQTEGGIGPASMEPRDLELGALELRAHASIGGTLPVSSARAVLVDAVDRRIAGTVPGGAVLVHPEVSWDHLVLPPEDVLLLEEAVSRAEIQQGLENRGSAASGRRGTRGLRLLFSGPPGTGKTLAAEVLAAALGRDLLIVDISRLVSKWIGETEKNLAGVFEAAERGDAVLFFDEADAMFGKRTEVSDARDRYANLETAYLLSRLERFEGVVVLATNLRRNIDSAFARRIEFVVPFDPPEEEARLRLWELHVPDWAVLADDVRLDELAALYELPGGLIRNGALAAAYLAAGERAQEPDPLATKPCITTAHLVHAIRREHHKAGLAFPGSSHQLSGSSSEGVSP